MTQNLLDRGYSTITWWIAILGAILPAVVVGTILLHTTIQPNEYAVGALAWGIGAALAVRSLEFWHEATKRFITPNFWTSISIGAIVGAFVALLAAMLAEAAIPAVARAVAALLGALQGVAVAWLIARPDLDVPPVLQSDGDEPDDDDSPSDRDQPNPPTSS